jgi:putative transposase
VQSAATAYRRIQVLRRRKRKGIGPCERRPRPRPTTTNQSWSMDFIADGLANGCAVWPAWTTTVASAWRLRSILPGTRVAAVLDRLADYRGLPASVTVDHGLEFAGRVLDAWAYARGVTLPFIRPGKPIEHADVERFNGRCRDACLNEHWVESLAHARRDRALADRLQYRSARTALWTISRQSSMRVDQGRGFVNRGL